MRDLEIRHPREDEYDKVASMKVDAFAEFAAGMSPDAWAQFAQRIADVNTKDSTGELLVAIRDGRIVGAITLYSHSDDLHPGAYTIKGLAVPPSDRGTGVGSALLAWCMERARADGRARLVATTTPEMEDAIQLYTKHGFVRDPSLDEKPAPGVVASGYAVEL